MKSNPLLLAALTVAISAAIALPTHAVSFTFNNRTNFLAATGAFDATGAIPNLGAVTAPGTRTVGAITFKPLAGHILRIGAEWTPILPGNDIAVDSSEDFDVSFASSYAFGFDVVEPTSGPGVTPFGHIDSTFTLTLLNGLTLVGSYQFSPSNNVATFIGVWTDTAFNGVRIRETTGALEDEYFGRFFLGSEAVPTPDAGSVGWLLAAGVAALAGFRRVSRR